MILPVIGVIGSAFVLHIEVLHIESAVKHQEGTKLPFAVWSQAKASTAACMQILIIVNRSCGVLMQ